MSLSSFVIVILPNGKRPLQCPTILQQQWRINWYKKTVFLRFGFLVQIYSDQGRKFENDLFKAMCDLLCVEETRTVPYNPKSDGMIEGFNSTLAAMLSMFVNANQKDWDDSPTLCYDSLSGYSA